MSEHDSGFTLIEVLIAIGVMTMVMGAATTAFVVGVQISNDSTQRLAVSQDAAFTSAVFDKDVQGASSVLARVGVTPISGSCSGTNTVLALSLGTANAVDYVYDAVDGVGQLTRVPCGARAGQRVVTARQLRAMPTPACSPACAAAREVTLVLEQVDGGSVRLNAVRRAA